MSSPGVAMVIGGAGFVASHLVERLIADGTQVEVVDDLSTGSLANLGAARSYGSGLRINHMDVMAPEFADLVALRQPSTIFHMALLPTGATRNVEVLNSSRLLLSALEAARHNGVKKIIVAIPAGLLYGEVPVRSLPVKEGYKSEPMGVAHVMANALVDLLRVYRESYDLEFTALAMTNVYGQRQSSGVVADFASCLANNRQPTILGNGRQTRDFLFIDDAVDALVKATMRGGGLVINVGTGVQTSILALWQLMSQGSTLKSILGPAQTGDLQRMAVNATRARIQLNWASWTSLGEGIAQLLAD